MDKKYNYKLVYVVPHTKPESHGILKHNIKDEVYGINSC